jgi:hypothetical protein
MAAHSMPPDVIQAGLDLVDVLLPHIADVVAEQVFIAGKSVRVQAAPAAWRQGAR